MHRTAFVALGSNVGDRLGYLRAAADAIRVLAGAHGFRASRVYATPALKLDGLGTLDDDDAFLNTAVSFETDATPHQLLADLLAIETRLGRLPREQRPTWGPRPIDLDLLLLGDERVDDATLTLPHPRITERWFVLAPLADLAPDRLLRGADSAQPPKRIAEWLAACEASTDAAAGVGRIYADASWASAESF
ncbi:MAG: 2-amino-4-hydroxy-6-hydroxymethyldihydropteridine diphosphokinase [Planctomycetota bacterium]